MWLCLRVQHLRPPQCPREEISRAEIWPSQASLAWRLVHLEPKSIKITKSKQKIEINHLSLVPQSLPKPYQCHLWMATALNEDNLIYLYLNCWQAFTIQQKCLVWLRFRLSCRPLWFDERSRQACRWIPNEMCTGQRLHPPCRRSTSPAPPPSCACRRKYSLSDSAGISPPDVQMLDWAQSGRPSRQDANNRRRTAQDRRIQRSDSTSRHSESRDRSWPPNVLSNQPFIIQMV